MKELYDANNLISAFNKAKKGCIWKESVQRYEINLLKNTYESQKAIKEGNYKQKPFFKFKLNERGHQRLVKSLHISDRVIQRTVCDELLIPNLNKYLIYDNGASIKGKGIDFTRNRFEAHLQKYIRKHGIEGYILQIDFKKFFDNIQHEPLIKYMGKKIPDAESMNFVEHLIDGFKVDVSWMSDEQYKYCMTDVYNALEDKHTCFKGEKFMCKSLGIGSQISQISGVFYPSVLDNFCKIVCGCKYYARYMDDIYVIHQSKEYLKWLLKQFNKISKSLGLYLNEKKTQIVKLSHGFTFLKIRYKLTSTGKIIKKMSRTSITRERIRLKKYKNLIEKGQFTFVEVFNQYKSWKGTLKRFRCYRTIKSMDRVFLGLYCNYLKGGEVV